MLKKTNNDYKEPFEILITQGYDKFLWFNKYGEFSNYYSNYIYDGAEFINNLCLRNIHDWDFHYDIIAIHKDSKINLFELAEMQIAKRIKSRY